MHCSFTICRILERTYPFKQQGFAIITYVPHHDQQPSLTCSPNTIYDSKKTDTVGHKNVRFLRISSAPVLLHQTSPLQHPIGITEHLYVQSPPHSVHFNPKAGSMDLPNVGNTPKQDQHQQCITIQVHNQ